MTDGILTSLFMVSNASEEARDLNIVKLVIILETNLVKKFCNFNFFLALISPIDNKSNKLLNVYFKIPFSSGLDN